MSLSPTERARLSNSLIECRKRLKPYRDMTKDMLRQIVGASYGGTKADRDVVVNLLAMAEFVMRTSIVAANPRVFVKATDPQYEMQATITEAAANDYIEALDLKRVLDRWVAAALVSPVGIIKCGEMDDEWSSRFPGLEKPDSSAFAETVDFDDWVQDTDALSLDQITFCGNRYSIPLEAAKESGRFKKDRIETIAKRQGLEEAGETRTAEMQKAGDKQRHGFEDFIEVWDIWLPTRGRVLTLAADFDKEELDEWEWEGPPTGPYHLLAFEEILSQSLPNAPLNQLFDLHMVFNVNMRKLRRQAERSKVITGTAKQFVKDLQTVQGASDGDTKAFEDMNNLPREMRFGGPDNGLFMFNLSVKRLFSWIGGNLETLGGLSPQAETLGQEQMLGQNASRRIQTMQETMVGATRRLVRDLLWYYWDDDSADPELHLNIPGTDMRLPLSFAKSDRMGEFSDFKIDIEPYSLRPQTPEARLQTLMFMMDRIIQMAGLLQQQGHQIDGVEMFKLMARYAHFDEIENIIRFAPPDSASQNVEADQPRAPATTRHEYQRSAKPRAADDQDHEMMMSLLAQPQRAMGAA